MALSVALAAGLAALRISVTIDQAYSRYPRYWEDVQLAAGLFVDGEFPVAFDESPGAVNPTGIRAEHSTFRAAAAQIPPWKFWRTVPLPARDHPSILVSRSDDSGRALALALLFRSLGGVSPWAPFWVCFFLFVPALAWLCWEFRIAGATTAAPVAAFLLGTSCFVAECLGTSYSPVGFYVVAVIMVAAYAVYACMSPAVSARGLALRSTLAGLGLALCVMGRSGSLLVSGGLFAALIVAVVRLHRSTALGPPIIAAIAAAMCALLLGPAGLVKLQIGRVVESTFVRHGQPAAPAQSHPVWFAIWGGLGDFDRAKGHTWDDRAISAAAVGAGGTPLTTFYDLRNEPLLRDQVVDHVVGDPLWFAGILARRLVATVLQTKLWPWIPISGRSLAPAAAPNEGIIDSYYALTKRIDFFGIGRVIGELPIALLIGPTVLLMLASVWSGVGRRRVRPGSLGVLACLAAATLPSPILITTAGALETQTFGVVYLIGAALLIQAVRPSAA